MYIIYSVFRLFPAHIGPRVRPTGETATACSSSGCQVEELLFREIPLLAQLQGTWATPADRVQGRSPAGSSLELHIYIDYIYIWGAVSTVKILHMHINADTI